MAEQIPYGVATSLINTLASIVSKEIASIYGVGSDIQWLKETVEDIKAVLADADQKQNTDQLIQRWIMKLKKVLYEADDLLDEIHAQHLLHKRDSKGKGKVHDFFSSSNPIVFRHKIASKIRNTRKQFNDVSENMSKLNLDPRVVVAEMKHEKRNWRETSSFVLQEDMVGREGNKKDIIDLLLNHNNNGSNNQNVSLVAIVGIGGLGKTALAQLVYNDAEVEHSFDKRMWVCVSEEFDVKVLVKQILESLLDQKEDDQSLQLLQNKLKRNLDGQKFLLVLDDIWNEDPEEWLHLRKFLVCGAEGSKILLTTRNEVVANVMGVKSPYLLKGLNNDQSWTLLKRLAFDEAKIMTENLESIGRKIAEKCGGVPLAIRVLGSLLRTKSQESDWEEILEGDFWKLRESKNSIMPILKLSYDSLTIELKECFAYCSLYPKDWEYRKEELIDLWMAQGFLGNKDEEQCPKDVGEDYVRILLMNSFLQDVETDEFAEIISFKMHDLMHDLSQSIASSHYGLYAQGRKNIAKSPMHVSFENYNSDDSLNAVDPSGLRTFLEIKKKHERNPSELLVFKRLRSLDLSFYEMSCLPESIGKMRHLRYLNLSFCRQLICLPKSIVNLVHLETLKMKECYNLKYSVDIITELINLRKLDIEDCKAFEDGLPLGLGRMTNLQSLSDFIVGNDDKWRKKAKLNELKELNLRGRLVIKKLNSVKDVEEESKDVNLRTKENLVSLTLSWGEDPEKKNSNAIQLLENLRPHQNLKTLRTYSYPGACLSDWLLSCTNLVELKIWEARSCQHLAALEGLVSLKTLWLESMEKLECIYYKGYSSSTTFFPSLGELEIRSCESFRGWQKEANVPDTRDNEQHHSLPQFSRLSSLTIVGCPNLSCLPTFPNLVRRLELIESSRKPLLDTLNVSRIGPSTSHNDMVPSLSMLKHLRIVGIDMESLPGEWMQNLSSLQDLSIANISSPEKPFRHMQNLSAKLEQLSFWSLDSWCGSEDYSIPCQDLCCLRSLQKIEFNSCNHLEALPEWICHLQSLRSIYIWDCRKLMSFPEGMCRLTNLQTLQVVDGSPLLKKRCLREKGAEWTKIAHIPHISFDFTRI